MSLSQNLEGLALDKGSEARVTSPCAFEGIVFATFYFSFTILSRDDYSLLKEALVNRRIVLVGDSSSPRTVHIYSWRAKEYWDKEGIDKPVISLMGSLLFLDERREESIGRNTRENNFLYFKINQKKKVIKKSFSKLYMKLTFDKEESFSEVERIVEEMIKDINPIAWNVYAGCEFQLTPEGIEAKISYDAKELRLV